MAYFAAVDAFGLGFSMGLIVGEGSFTGDRQQPAVQIRMHARDLEALEHVRKELGGRVFGPYVRGGRNSCVYLLRGHALKTALPLLERFLPNSWKRVQFEAWRTKYTDYFDRHEPSPALLDRLERILPRGSR